MNDRLDKIETVIRIILAICMVGMLMCIGFDK